MDFRRDETLMWEHGNGNSERVRFVKMCEFPLARPTWSEGNDEDTVGTFPGPEPAAIVSLANGKEMTVLVADLRRPCEND